MKDDDIIHLIRENKYNPAMKGLYAYFPVVKKFILKNSGTRQEAEDIFQEGLVIFCGKLEKSGFVLSSSINTYLFGVCRLLWLDELKKKRRQAKAGLAGPWDEQETERIYHDIEDDRPRRQAQAAVMILGQKCRELLELFYFKKTSMKDIAKLLGFSSEKVAKNQKYRCIEKAKEHLKQSSI